MAALPQQPHSSRFADQPGTSPFVDTSTFLGPNPTDNFLFARDSGAARNNLLCGHRLGMFKTVYPVPVFTNPHRIRSAEPFLRVANRLCDVSKKFGGPDSIHYAMVARKCQGHHGANPGATVHRDDPVHDPSNC
jgi:hypothetical protein